MRAIQRDDITKVDAGFRFNCINCNAEHTVSTKASAIKTLQRGSCKKCTVHYRILRDQDTNERLGVYQASNGKWSTKCSGCGAEQQYTRKDHARQSARADWKCKKCASYENHSRVCYYNGFFLVDVDKIMRSAHGRGLCWEIDIDFVCSMWEAQKGLCALSGLPMEKTPKTWSIDRIKNDVGYTKDNVQLVLNEINMMKQKYDEDQYISLCCAVAKHRGCL